MEIYLLLLPQLVSMTRLFYILFLIVYIHKVHAQPWLSDGGSHNFFAIQKEFNDYWQNKTVERGKGWKQFKRWEWYWQDRVDSLGHFPPAGLVLDNFTKFKRENKNAGRILQANWQPLGPQFTIGGYAGIGRIGSIAFHPTNSNIIFAGAAGGGLWKSTDGGNSWMTTTDDLASLGVSGIAIHPSDPNTIYLATGDGDGGDNYSIGVVKSTDGGLNFSSTGLNWSTSSYQLIRRILIDADNPAIIMVATSGGIYKSSNNGMTWANVLSGDFYDLEAKPGNGETTWYASTANNIYRSTNEGNTWTSVYNVSGSGRLSLGVSAGNNQYVYALSSLSSNHGFKGLYRSIDSGTSFTLRSSSPNIMGWAANGTDSGGQGWYDLALAIDPVDAEKVYTGGVNTWKSTNGGTTWTIKTHWSGATGVQTVHADKHVLEWQGTNVLWEGNDGGLYRTPDGGNKWEHKTNGMMISMIYRIGVSQTSSKVIAGLQDNGTKLRNTNGIWSDVIGGDGMDCAIKNTDANTMYGSLYNGTIYRSTNGGASWADIQANIPGVPTGAWVTPYVLNPSNNSNILAAYNEVYSSSDQGTTWTSIGNTTQVGGSTKTILAVAPSNGSYIYTGNSSVLYRTTNGGSSWSLLTSPGGGISRLIIHPTDPNIIWCTLSNFSSGQKVLKSVNGGSTWTNLSGNLPNLPANTLVYQNSSSNGIYVGMDMGVYYKDDNMSEWELFADGLPNAEITDLEIDYTNNFILAGTYGRGMWKTELRNTVPACLYPTQVSADNITNTSIFFSWDVNSQSNGFEYAMTATSLPPSSGNTINGSFINITGLTSNTNYYFHIRTVCSTNTYSQWVTVGPIKTAVGCEQTFYDSGGSGASYSNEESKIWTICPTTSCYNVKATFSSLNIEANWDALYVFNGPSITSPMLASNNSITLAGFPAGGYYGTSVPGPFASTHSTGCLTFRFLSDEATTGSGWAAAITCVLKNPLVTNTNDDGPGSLREAIACAPTGTTLTIDNSLTGQFIDLTSTTIVLNKNINIVQTPSTEINIRASNDLPIFEVSSCCQLYLKNINLYPDSGNTGRALINNGTLTLDDTHIFENGLHLGSGSTVQNNGTLTVIGNSGIIKI